MNINIQDNFYASIEAYNACIKKKHNISEVEKKGIFYNHLRKYFPIFNTSRIGVPIDCVSCSFREDGTILSFTINKSIKPRSYWNSNNLDIGAMTEDLKTVSENHKIIYPTKTLNELSQILKL